MGRKSLKHTRRKEIIRVFYKLAKKDGLENISIAKIAGEMAINPSLIIHYFQTREELTYGLIDYILDKYGLIYRTGKSGEHDSRTSLLGIIDNIFSKKWNALFDDGVFYYCYSLTFRDQKVRELYKKLLDSLRERLCEHIRRCADDGHLEVKDPELMADAIFVLADGAYFYLSLVTDEQEYERKRLRYREQAIAMLDLSEELTGVL